MIKTALTLSFLTALGMSAHAVLPVEDYAALAQRAQKSITDAANHALDYAKAIENEFNTYSTRLYTYEQQLNSAEQLLRYGTAANTIGRLPGVSTVANLYQTSQRLQQDYQNWKSFANPQRYQQTANGILSSYRQPQLSSFTTAGGYQIPPSQLDYGFDTQRWSVAQKTYTDLDQLQQQRQSLMQEHIRAKQLHDSSRTDQDAVKYGKALDDVNQQIAQIDKQIDHAGLQAQLQRQKIGDEENVVRTNQAHQQEQMQYQAIDTDLNELPSGGFHRGVRWGSN
jgi:hypothetical protein